MLLHNNANLSQFSQTKQAVREREAATI